MKAKSRIQGQILQVDYDRVLTLSDEECCYSLSEKEVAMILSQTEYFGWKTRWNSASETEINQDEIDALKSALERKLMSGCCPDEGQLGRFTSDGVYQTSDDGGTTWEDNPDVDPRNNATQAPPLGGTGSNTKCAAADNVRDTFKAYKATVRGLLEAGTTVLAIVAGLIGALGLLLGLTGVALPVSVLLFGMAAALLSLTPEELDAALTDTVFDDFRCLVYCVVNDDGTFSYANWQTLISQVDSTFSGFPEQFFHAILAAMGYIGLNNAATTGPATASDCEDCDCPVECGAPEGITYGDVIDSGLDELGRTFLVVESVVFPGDTFNLVAWGEYGANVPPNICCHLTDATAVVNNWISSEWTDCAGSVHATPGPAGHDLGHAVFYNNGSSFTIRLTFEGCYSC